ncbi:DUF6044 family protein [Halobacillus shinanisalinarum]|uniref:DUF6044 family protein n=1 Tax=Halobacillus shinanisalinarum TaxID=2932258 RepID=A0ABY4GY19_9BACI|nr:DUF6044 family protein [Halobacillus shinanisalinarum]UOQ92974.1 DUF6044 family protein [Halobacillus shinanisalinarum]
MWSTILRTFSKNKWIVIGCLIIVAYLMPYYILGEDTHIRVHDNLDSNIVWYKILAESGQIFAPPGTTLPYAVNGLPRSALSSSLDLMVWLYVWFEPFTAYTINQTIMRFVGFFGMYGLLRFLFQTRDGVKKLQLIAVGVSVGFALLPFWPSGALSIAGLPLALLAFLNIRKFGRRTSKLYWLIIVLLPFHSSLILSFVFFLALMGLVWIVDWFRTKRVNMSFLGALFLMGSIYLIKNYTVIISMFFSGGFTSHREEFDLGHNSLAGTIRLFNKNFIFAHTHDMSLHQQVILPAVILAVFIAIYKRIKPNRLAVAMTMNFLLSLWYAFWYWEGFRVLKDESMILNTFNFSRIHFLHPLFWYMAFAFALVIVWKNLKLGKPIVIVLMVVQIGIVFGLNEEKKYSEIGTPTFEEFYSQDLFNNIKKYIGKAPSNYQVVSVAMHPTIAQYNGMHTLDTYNTTYPLSYKHKFRKIIAPELEKNQNLESYFDTWGGRLYMYVGELGKDYVFSKNSDEVIEQLDINTEQLQQMGGDYVLSALPIENHESIGLEFEKAFQHASSPWKIHLYKVEL